MASPASRRTTTFTTPSALEVMITRVVGAPRLPHWMLGPEGWTMQVCEIDLRLCGARDTALGTGMREGVARSFDLLDEYLQADRSS